VRGLKNNIKPIRSKISSYTNTIKHSQGRIRLFSGEFIHDGREMHLHGFFIDGFKNGAMCPNPVLHGNGEVIVSITAFLWSVITYLFLISKELTIFIKSIGANENVTRSDNGNSPLFQTIIALCRLPHYSFDDSSPFTNVQVSFYNTTSVAEQLSSGIYGSLLTPWSKSTIGRTGRCSSGYEGDGTTRSFEMARPKQITLNHWNNGAKSVAWVPQ
jgi:hypothetical protein